jgi:hypothetical protein
MAYDAENLTRYFWAEHYRSEAEPVVHASAIKARGAWMAGKIDPAAIGSSQVDGRAFIKMYRDLGLELSEAENTIYAGVAKVWEEMQEGRLKIFRSCQSLMAEIRIYRRSEKGQIVKERDHLVDCMRYGVMSGIDWLKRVPVPRERQRRVAAIGPHRWMA